MADHAGDYYEGNVYVLVGGRAPRDVTHVRIDRSADEIENIAFRDCEALVKVEMHDGIRSVGDVAFWKCISLPQINLSSALEICSSAFYGCVNLAHVEFGDELERIGANAFSECTSLEHLNLPSIVTIGAFAFRKCRRLIDIEFPKQLETIGKSAFFFCDRLQRIAIPLKRDLFAFDVENEGYTQFLSCEQLVTVDLVGGIHRTVASLHMDRWRTVMIAKINRINQILPNTHARFKTGVIRQWMESVLDKIDNYKTKHCRYVKEGIALLELALWKTKLGEKEESPSVGKSKKAKIDAESARKERRITCGADIVIKNVLPFLQLE